MGRVKILSLTLFAAFLLFVPKMEAQIYPPPRPVCASQFALANYACAILPITPSFPPTPPPAPPAPSPPDDDEGQEGHGHGHRHRHRHRYHEPAPASFAEENCCRWLSQVDSSCVCQLLVHLPAFLLKPAHAYTVTVGEACRFTYTCGTSTEIKV